MGEYADDQYRRDVQRMHGFDPGSMYDDDKPQSEWPRCPKCGKQFRVHLAIRDHIRNQHQVGVK